MSTKPRTKWLPRAWVVLVSAFVVSGWAGVLHLLGFGIERAVGVSLASFAGLLCPLVALVLVMSMSESIMAETAKKRGWKPPEEEE